MRVGPLFKWFGSKWQSARRYPAPIGDSIVEPYAGSAGYALNYAEKSVMIFDNDPNLLRLWPWLIAEATEASVRDIPIGLPVGTDVRTLGLSDGQALLLKHWQRTNNVGDCWTTSPWGHLPGQWTANTRARVSEEVGAVKHWVFSPELNPSLPRSTWFIDPVYLFNYRYRNGADFDHSAVAQLVGSIAQDSLVIVCEAAEKSTGRLPDYLPFVASHQSVTSRRKASQSHHSREAIFVRGNQDASR